MRRLLFTFIVLSLPLHSQENLWELKGGNLKLDQKFLTGEFAISSGRDRSPEFFLQPAPQGRCVVFSSIHGRIPEQRNEIVAETWRNEKVDFQLSPSTSQFQGKDKRSISLKLGRHHHLRCFWIGEKSKPEFIQGLKKVGIEIEEPRPPSGMPMSSPSVAPLNSAPPVNR